MGAARVRHSVLLRRSTGQLWLVGVSHRCGAVVERRDRSAMVEDASGSRVAGSQEPAHVEPSSKPQSWARQIPAVGRTAGFGKPRSKGHTPRHSALRPMSVTMPRPMASQPVRSGARPGMPSTAPQPRPRRLRPRHPCPDLSTPCVAAVLSTPANQLPGRSSRTAPAAPCLGSAAQRVEQSPQVIEGRRRV